MKAAAGNVVLAEQPMDVDLSPEGAFLAVGLITGQLEVLSYKIGGESVTHSPCHSIQFQVSGESCRAVRFDFPGRQVFCGGADCAIASYDVESGRLLARMEAAHGAPVSALARLSPDEPHLMASGDEDGGLALWDARVGQKIMRYSLHTDTINAIGHQARDQCLLAVSGDGTLSVHDLRTRKPRHRSETDADDEYLSVAVAKKGNKVVCGTQSGALNIFSWGYFNDCSDRFMGHPESVDALVAFDDDTLISGSSDGGVRLLQLFPNKLLGVVGEHSADMPVERLALSGDRRVLASASHDCTVKLWDLSYLVDDEDDDGDDDGSAAAAQATDERPADGGGPEALASSATCEAGAGASAAPQPAGPCTAASDSAVIQRPERGDGAAAVASGSGAAVADRGSGGIGSSSSGRGVTGKGKKGVAKVDAVVDTEQTGAVAGEGIKEEAGEGEDGAEGEEEEDDESDEDEGPAGGRGRKGVKRARHEKTKWTAGRERNTRNAGGQGGNFFADLL